MNIVDVADLPAVDEVPAPPDPGRDHPFVSVIVPAYNEAVILMDSLTQLYEYLQTLDDQYRWELVVVNDGSTDETPEIAEAFARGRPQVRVLHHAVNFQLGQALRYAFRTCTGDYVVTVDCDLSYSPDHIGTLLEALRANHARVALASPYMKGGRLSNVPFARRVLSRQANRFLSFAAEGRLSTLTGMVRAYDRPFLSSLNLKAMGTDINTEILYKAQLLKARIVEVPAHLDWSVQRQVRRPSSTKMRRSTSSYLFSGFIFRPVAFFILPGLVLLALAVWTLGGVAWRTWDIMGDLDGSFDPRLTRAVARTFEQRPHSFIVGGISLILSVQLISLGILASQSKRYFEELFHLGTSILRGRVDSANPADVERRDVEGTEVDR